MSSSSDVLVRISVEYFQSLCHFIFVLIWRTIAHIVKHLIPDWFVFILGKFKDSFPEFLEILQYTARAHLLSCLNSDFWVFTFAQFYELTHVSSFIDLPHFFVVFDCLLLLRLTPFVLWVLALIHLSAINSFVKIPNVWSTSSSSIL